MKLAVALVLLGLLVAAEAVAAGATPTAGSGRADLAGRIALIELLSVLLVAGWASLSLYLPFSPNFGVTHLNK
jgi:hypothetical protein